MDVFEAISSRTSKRAFLDRPVQRELIEEVLGAALRAPSAINLQPWEITVVSGEERRRLSRLLLRQYQERKIGCGAGTATALPERLKARQYSSFLALTEALGAGSEEVSRFVNEGSLNFYGAPTALIITKEKLFPHHYLCSLGLMIGYLLLAAQAKGLATCPVGLILPYQDAILDFLNLPDRDLVLGVALGYADPEAPVNQARTPREPIESLIRWYG
ncbi:MAG: nitroreductase [Thermodesulfobacteriota bacterium]